MPDTLIRGAYVMTMDEGLDSIAGGDVLIRGNRIAAVGKDLEAAGARVIDGRGRIVMPGLVDGHRHMYAGLLRGGCSDASYVGNEGGYFEILIRRLGGSYLPEDSYIASRLGALESIAGGITTLHAWEHNLLSHAHAEASARAMHETGLRGRFSFGPPNDTMIVRRDDLLRLKRGMFTEHVDGRWETVDGRWHLGLATRGVELEKPEIWEPEFAFARGEGLPVTAHVMAGQIPALKQRRALGPDVLAVHVMEASDDDIAYLVESRTPVCVATAAAARTGQHPSPIARLMRAGVPLCLSVDSVAGCDTADMFAVMRISLMIERMLYDDAGVYSTRDVLRQATIGGAEALGLGDVTGSLTPGKRADVIVINARALNLAPLTVPETLVSSCVYPSNVETVFVDGRCLKRDGALVGVDVEAVVEQANSALHRLEQRAGQKIQ
jgi:5-methylthioadenosine/S-adenosylhomocysteine deaminase